MNQEYLDILFQNYTGVEKWHFTSDGTAFKEPSHALTYAARLEDSTVKVVANGGQVTDAVIYEPNADTLSTEAVAMVDAAPDLNEFTVPVLKQMCALRAVNIDGITKKADIIAAMHKAAEAAAAAADGTAPEVTDPGAPEVTDPGAPEVTDPGAPEVTDPA